MDIIVVNSKADNILIFFGDDHGTFELEWRYSTGKGSSPSSISVGDLNNDKILDIVVGNFGTNNILIFYGYGNGTFGSEASYQLGYEFGPTAVGIGDLNNDQWMDITVACYTSDGLEILIKQCL